MLNVDINVIFTLINLVIFYILFRKFLFTPVRNIIAKRQEEIEQGYTDAAAAKAEAEKIKAEYEKSTASIEDERKEKLAAAQTEANQEYERIIADANQQKDKIIEQAGVLAKAEADKQITEARDQIADMVKSLGEDIVSKKSSESELFDAFLDAADKQ